MYTNTYYILLQLITCFDVISYLRNLSHRNMLLLAKFAIDNSNSVRPSGSSGYLPLRIAVPCRLCSFRHHSFHFISWLLSPPRGALPLRSAIDGGVPSRFFDRFWTKLQIQEAKIPRKTDRPRGAELRPSVRWGTPVTFSLWKLK